MTHRITFKLTAAAAAAALACLASPLQARDGYVTHTQSNVVTTATGDCVKTGYWTPADAALPCDAVRVVQAPPPPVAVVQPAPAPAPAPAPTPLVTAPPPQPPVIEQISLSSDVLFEFDKAELRPSGREKLDEIADRLKGANVAQILAVGHADRIGPAEYNRELSERRAESVRDYLTKQGVEPQKVRVEGRGQSQPVTAGQCKGMTGQKLIACLQPDRRVDIEVRGERQVAGTPAPGAAAGTTSGSSAGGATSGGTTK